MGGIDFRIATNKEVAQWMVDQADGIDKALDRCNTEGERLGVLTDVNIMLMSLVCELFKRVPQDGGRPK